MMAQQITPNTQNRQENAWTNGNSTNPVPHVQDESFPSLDTPRENVSAKALQEENFARADANGLGKQQRRRKSRRDQPRRDIKRVNGNEDGGLPSFTTDSGGTSESAAEPSSTGLGDANLQNGHMSRDSSQLPSNGSPRGNRFENVFDDVPHRDNGYHRHNNHGYNNKYGRRQHHQNRRRFNNRFDHDRMQDSDALSPRSGSNEDDETSRRHHGGGSPDRSYGRRRRDSDRRFQRDRFRDGGRWHNGRHGNYGRRNSYNDRRHNRNYENGNDMDNNHSMSNENGQGRGGHHPSGMSGGAGMGAPGFGPGSMSGPGGVPGAVPGQFGQNADFSAFGNTLVGVNPSAPQFNYPVVQYPQQMFPYQQAAAVQFPGSTPVMPMYTMPGQMVMFPFPGVVTPDMSGSMGQGAQQQAVTAGQLQQQPNVTELNVDGMMPDSTITTTGNDPIVGIIDSLAGVVPVLDEQSEVSDMTKLSEPTAEHPSGDVDEQQTAGEEESADVSASSSSDVFQQGSQTNLQGGPLSFGDVSSGFPADVQSVVVQPSVFGIPQLWGGYNPLVTVGGVPASVAVQPNADPAYNVHIQEQSSQVAVTDTGTHFPAHGDECEIPRGPYFCLKVACVATGPRHDERDVGQVVVVDFNCQVVCNVYVKSGKPIVSYLDPLTSLAPGTWIQQYGLPLSEAKRIVREVIPKNAVIVGQNVYQDLQWLDMKKGENYRASIDLRDLWHVWNDVYTNFTHFSLEHQAKCILHHPGIDKHNAPLDANLTMQLFIAYLEARAQKSGTKLQDMRQLLLQFRQDPSFSRKHPQFEGVCMGHRRYCKCGAPPLNALGTPFLMGRRKSQSANNTPIGSPTTTRAPLEVEDPTKDGDVASAPVAVSTVVEPPVVVSEDGETLGEDTNANHVDNSLNVSE